VAAVCPGYIDTPPLAGLPPAVKEQLKALHPMGRLGRARKKWRARCCSSPATMPLSSPASLLVDGGYTAQ
jgi:NAD(P)-dependent dehydrogenase (short-subunit alcohol dehydrogenase family)